AETTMPRSASTAAVASPKSAASKTSAISRHARIAAVLPAEQGKAGRKIAAGRGLAPKGITDQLLARRSRGRNTGWQGSFDALLTPTHNGHGGGSSSGTESIPRLCRQYGEGLSGPPGKAARRRARLRAGSASAGTPWCV